MYELTDADHLLIDDSVAVLERVGIFPHLGIEHEDIEDAVCDDLALFRRRPLLTLLGACDPTDDLVFFHVFVDDSPFPRTTLEDFERHFYEVAVAAGTASDLSGLYFFLDADSSTRGSLRYQLGDWDVVDLDFDIDPEFCDVKTESKLPQLLALPGMTAHTFEGACRSNALTVWVNEAAAKSSGFLDAIEDELAR